MGIALEQLTASRRASHGNGRFRALTAALVVCASLPLSSCAPVTVPGQARLYLSPATLVVQPGQEFDVEVRVDVKSDLANVIGARVEYAPNGFIGKGVTVNNSTWDIPVRSSIEDGLATLELGATDPIRGDHLIATLRMKSVAGGQISFKSNSVVVSADSAKYQTVTADGGVYNVGPQDI